MSLKIFSGFALKVIGTLLMVIDHIGYFIPSSPAYFRWIGRIVAPMFFFLATEGYDHTRDRNKYIKRLYIAALVMFVGSIILWIPFREEAFITNNIFFTLAVNLSLIKEIEKDERNKLLIIIFILLALIAEGSFLATTQILIFYYLKQDKKKMSIAYVITSLLLIPDVQWMQVFSLPFILMYNGQRGTNIKKFFYIFYPAHIWMLFIISHYMYH